MNEKSLEKLLREKVKSVGGEALKFTSPYYTGWPDRIILMPGNRQYFVELKTPGRKTTPRQDNRIARLKSLGADVTVIDSKEKLITFMERITHGV